MTVKELIETLKLFSPDLQVKIVTDAGKIYFVLIGEYVNIIEGIPVEEAK